MKSNLSRRMAKPMLFLAAFIWGTSFFIMKNTLDSTPVFWLLTFRFGTGAILLGLFCWKKWSTVFKKVYVWRGAILAPFSTWPTPLRPLVWCTPRPRKTPS